MKIAKSALETAQAPIENGGTSTSRTGPSPSSGYDQGSSLPIANTPPSSRTRFGAGPPAPLIAGCCRAAPGSSRDGAQQWSVTLLAGHRDAQALLWRDQVVDGLRGRVDVDLDPVDAAGDAARLRRVVGRDRRAGVRADVARLIARENQRNRG